MTRTEPRIFAARMDNLALALGFVENSCDQHGVTVSDMLRLSLIVEELFTNTIVHGHGGDHDSPVRIELGVTLTQLELRYADCAPPFDPLRYLQDHPTDVDAQVEQRRVGGLGLPLVAQMVERFEHAYVDGFNCVELVLRRGG